MGRVMNFILSETGMKVIVGLIVLWFVWTIVSITMKKIAMGHYKKVKVGMKEDEMLNIMGGKPTVSNYENKKKFEWFLQGGSQTYYNNGIASTAHTPKKSVVITTEFGRVTAIEPHNI